MSERHHLSAKNGIQDPPKERYAHPELTTHGTVRELTQFTEVDSTVISGILVDETAAAD